MDLFDFPKYIITNKIRLIELFAGVGSQAMALRDIGADFEHYRVCEFDKYAIASYNAIHGTQFEPSDITKLKGKDLGIVDTDKYTYLMTYSFPCQDLSLAGKQKGMKKGSSTRSGLLWEVERLLTETKQLPQILLMENVPQVHGKKNKADFDKWLDFLRNKGYQNFWQDLNAKDFGIPQNRKRCFCVSILSNDFINYSFPEPQKLNLVMKDLLESDVDEKYYINSPKAKKLIEKLVVENKITDNKKTTAYMNYNFVDKVDTECAKTLCARDYKGFGTGFDTMNGVIECQK
jgi:DNA (cytosine-5)-methyltransferase 1